MNKPPKRTGEQVILPMSGSKYDRYDDGSLRHPGGKLRGKAKVKTAKRARRRTP